MIKLLYYHQVHLTQLAWDCVISCEVELSAAETGNMQKFSK